MEGRPQALEQSQAWLGALCSAASRLHDSSTDTAPRPWVQGTHSQKESLEFTSQPWKAGWYLPSRLQNEGTRGGLRSEVLVGMFLSHLRGHLVAQQPQSQVVPGQQSMGAPLPHGAAAPLRRAWNHSSLGRWARSAALATRIFVHQTQTGTNWSHRPYPHWRC